MPFAELLRATVFLTAGGATALAAVAVIGATREYDPGLLVIGGAWWLVAAWIGLTVGSRERAGDALRETLAAARTVGADSPGVNLSTPRRVAWSRLWPIPAAVGIAGALGVFVPEVAAIAAGYSLLAALSWRNREAAVLAVEGRDGVRFLIESARPFGRVRLIRAPGFRAF